MTFLGKIRFMPPQLREIGFHVQNHATQWHGFQHEIQFQEVVVIQAWKPSITMRQILIGIQHPLHRIWRMISLQRSQHNLG